MRLDEAIRDGFFLPRVYRVLCQEYQLPLGFQTSALLKQVSRPPKYAKLNDPYGASFIGLYSNLAKFNLPYPEAVFDIRYFRGDPAPCASCS